MSRSLEHMPHLDTLRAFAALLVLNHHWLKDLGVARFEFGAYGVDLFFTLSGFLITGILLRQKQKTHNAFGLVRNFIIKRSLRLFPIYFLFVGALIALSAVTGMWLYRDGGAPWFLTYTSNFFFYNNGMQGEQLNHTWSLAVEEQFYLIWPWLIVFLPRKKELWAIVPFILAGLLFKFTWPGLYPDKPVKVLPFYNLDTLGLGALLGYIMVYGKLKRTLLEKNISWIIILLIVLTFVLVHYSGTSYLVGQLLLPVSVLLLAGSLVYKSSIGFSGYTGRLFDSQVLQYIGKISYGVYLYHKPIPILLDNVFRIFNIQPIENKTVLYLCYAVITFALAHFSWKIIEQPILRFKERYDQ
jgi:peptidoglycan/LPS O-acetylase OafA/YrhL